MRELTVRISFTKHSLGSVKKENGRFLLARNPAGAVTFLASWHNANMRFAAQILGRHQDEVGKILWDIAVDATVKRDSWFRRYYAVTGSARQRYVLHESFVPGQVVGIYCVVPAAISDDDFWQLMQLAGRYKGLSPARPGEFGNFEVVSIRPRRALASDQGTQADTEAGLKQKGPETLPVSQAPSER